MITCFLDLGSRLHTLDPWLPLQAMLLLLPALGVLQGDRHIQEEDITATLQTHLYSISLSQCQHLYMALKSTWTRTCVLQSFSAQYPQHYPESTVFCLESPDATHPTNYGSETPVRGSHELLYSES